jgi:hypothetical protein
MHPFDRAKEFPNYFEIMLETVPERERGIFVKKIQKLIEQNISAIIKRLKLYYVNDQGKLSTADYFNELVKSMERVLKESPAKDDYNLEVYLSGGVVRTLLGYVYKQLHINIQEILENETELTHLSMTNQKDFFKNVTKTPEFWLQKLKTEKSILQHSYVLGVGSDMDILYKLNQRMPKNESKLNETQLQDLHQEVDTQSTLNKAKLEAFRQAIETTRKLDEKQFYELFQAVKNKAALSKEQLEDLRQIINNQRTLSKAQSQSLYQAIETGNELNEEQMKGLQQAIENQSNLNEKELQESYQTTESQSKLNEVKFQDLHQAIDSQNKLNGQALQEPQLITENKSTLDATQLDNLGNKIREGGDLFLNSAASFFNLDNVEETLKHSLLPPGDVNEYTKQTTSSMLQGGSALDWLAFEISPKTGRKLIEPPLELKQQVNMTQSIVENFIRGHYEYIEPQVEESEARRTASVARGLRPYFEIPFLKIKDEAVILKEMQDMENLEKRDSQGNIILAPRTLKQLEKLRRNTSFEGAHNRGTRSDPESPVLSTFLGISKKFSAAADGKMNIHVPKYVQRTQSFDKMPARGLYQSEINHLFIEPKTFIADFTDSGTGTLYHGTPLNAVMAIVRGGFYISDSTQGTAVYGSGLYSTNDRAVALSFGESVLPLHIDTDQLLKVINLDTMSPELLKKLREEAKKDGFLDIHGEAEVHELLKIRYHVDIIIHTYVLVQNSAVIKPITLTDIVAAYEAQFEQQFIRNITLGGESLKLIAENVNVEDVSQFFKHYANLCILSGNLENNNFSSMGIIKSLMKSIRQIEQAGQNFDLNNTRRFINEVFINAVDNNQFYVTLEIIRGTEQPLENRERNILAKMYALKNKNNDEMSAALFNLMLERKYNDSKGHVLRLASESGDMNSVVNMVLHLQYTREDLLSASMLASNAMKNDIALYLLDYVHKMDPSHTIPMEQTVLDTILINVAKNNFIDIFNKLLENSKFDEKVLREALWGIVNTNILNRGVVKRDERVVQKIEEIALLIMKMGDIRDAKHFFPSSSSGYMGSLLDFACSKKMNKLALTLLDKEPTLYFVQGGNQKSALMYACENGLSEVVDRMIAQRIPVDPIFRPYEEDPNGYNKQSTPLIAALLSEHPDIALILLNAMTTNLSVYCYDPYNTKSYTAYYNALDIAIEKGYVEVAHAIVKKNQEQGIDIYDYFDPRAQEFGGLRRTLKLAFLSKNVELINLIIDANLDKEPTALKNEVVKNVTKEVYIEAIKTMDIALLLAIFKINKEVMPGDKKKQLELLKQLDSHYFNYEPKEMQHVNVMLKLLENECLDLNTVQTHIESVEKSTADLWRTWLRNVTMEHLSGYPKLTIALAKHERFDKYLNSELCQALIKIRKTLPQEENSGFLPQLTIHYAADDALQDKKEKNTPPDNSSDTKKFKH